MTHFLPSMRVPTNILTRLSLWEESLCSYTNPSPLEATSCVTSERGRRRKKGEREEEEEGREGRGGSKKGERKGERKEQWKEGRKGGKEEERRKEKWKRCNTFKHVYFTSYSNYRLSP